MTTTKNFPDFRQYRYFDVLVNCFVVALLISNLVAPKLTQIGGFVFSGAQLLFPLTYIFGDVFTEVYGYAGSRRAIWTGFMAQGLLVVLGAVIVALPPAPGWKGSLFHLRSRRLIVSTSTVSFQLRSTSRGSSKRRMRCPKSEPVHQGRVRRSEQELLAGCRRWTRPGLICRLSTHACRQAEIAHPQAGQDQHWSLRGVAWGGPPGG